MFLARLKKKNKVRVLEMCVHNISYLMFVISTRLDSYSKMYNVSFTLILVKHNATERV